jgi:branched-chain amino acid transport system ATP-binding protein
MIQLEVKNLSKRFGGVQAVQRLTFTFQKGAVHSVIGPNGAGKTTLLNLITGIYTPSSGVVVFEGSDVTGASPCRLARLGMSRTFQNLQVCMNMTALENVAVGAHLRLDQSLSAAMLHLPASRRADRACQLEAARLMEFVGVGKYVDSHARSMPYGALKRLEIARALAAKPRMAMLDEPAAGLNETETREIEVLIRKIADTGVTVVLVEHDMKLVMGVSDHILVLNHGAKLAEGSAAEVRSNPAVITAYLGGPQRPTNEDAPVGVDPRAEVEVARRCLAQHAPEPVGPGGDGASARKASPRAGSRILEVRSLTSRYGRIQALRGLDLDVGEGQLVALVGANGAGKTTLLRTVSGVQAASGGSICFRDSDIMRLPPHKRVQLGICQVPEGRQVFGPMTVEDNLMLGAYGRNKPDIARDAERAYALFPGLKDKRRLPAGTLSGGQQQMLAMARALMGRPKLLLLDEPSMGLAPMLVEEIFRVVQTLKEHGITILLVEQNAHAALSIADVGYVLETGKVVLSGPGRDLLQNEKVRQAYLGI